MKEFKFLFNQLPFYVILYPTSRCNARCPHCYNFLKQDRASKDEELSLDEIKKISQNFGHIKVLTISGGEPFLRDDLKKIVSIFCENNKIQYVSFHTNAYLTQRIVEVIEGLLNKYPKLRIIVCISIDAIGQAHDDFRGVEGGFNKIVQTITQLSRLKERYRNLYLISSTIFSHSTQNSVCDTVQYILQNFKDIKPSLSFIRGNVKNSQEKDVNPDIYRDFHKRFIPEIDNAIKPFSAMAFKEVLEMSVNKIVANNYTKKKQTVSCQAGNKLVVIYENGDVFPCEIIGEKFGNLRELDYDIKKFLFSQKSREIKRKINNDRACYCTWENIIPVNLLFSPAHYPLAFCEWLRLFFIRPLLRNTRLGK